VRTWLNTNRTRTLVGIQASVTARRDLLLDVVVIFQTKLADMGVPSVATIIGTLEKQTRESAI